MTVFDDDEGIFHGYRIRRSLRLYSALGAGCSAVGFGLLVFLGNGPWAILAFLGAFTVVVVGAAEIMARYRERS